MSHFDRDFGDLTEDAVQAAVEAAFAPDFVFRAPRNVGGKEATDVLVLFDDVALVIQAKAQSSLERDPVSWARKNLKKATRQTKGAIRTMRSGRLSRVSNPRQGEVSFDPSDYPFMYGLAVLHHSPPPYSAKELVPETTQQTFPMHVLSFRDFANLAHYLDTPWDLVNYLEHRTDVLVPTLDPRVHDEKAVFSYFVSRYEEILSLRAEQRGEQFTMEDAQPTGEFLRASLQGTVDSHPGRLIDILIDRIHNIDPDLEPISVDGKQFPQTGITHYIEIARHLAAIPRARRVALGRRALRLARRAAQTGKSDYFLTASRKRDDCIMYLVSTLPREKREQRREQLLLLTQLAKSYCAVTRAIGIATTAPNDDGGAEDYIFIERREDPPSESTLKLGREHFGDLDGRLSDELEHQ